MKLEAPSGFEPEMDFTGMLMQIGVLKAKPL
jgi:hypothetical protein